MECPVCGKYYFTEENSFDISCKIVERNETIFEIKTFVGSQKQATDIVHNWKNHANEMYPALLKILTDIKK